MLCKSDLLNKDYLSIYINYVSTKIAGAVGLIYRLNEYFPLDILKTLYFRIILSYITYGIEACYGPSQSVLNRIIT